MTQAIQFDLFGQAVEQAPATAPTAQPKPALAPVAKPAPESSDLKTAIATLDGYRNSRAFRDTGIRPTMLHLWAVMQEDELMEEILTALQHHHDLHQQIKMGPPRNNLYFGKQRFIEILKHERALRESGKSNAMSARRS